MASPTFTSADRIRELSTISNDVAAMVASAGNAINTLASRPLEKPEGGAEDPDHDTEMAASDLKDPLEARKAAFTKHTTAYYETLQAVMARLRRQAFALEEAGIIAAETPSSLSTTEEAMKVQQAQQASRGPSRAQGVQQSAKSKSMPITNGGLGNLDVGRLNASGNKVGAEKEAELLVEAKELLENMIRESERSSEPT